MRSFCATSGVILNICLTILVKHIFKLFWFSLFLQILLYILELVCSKMHTNFFVCKINKKLLPVRKKKKIKNIKSMLFLFKKKWIVFGIFFLHRMGTPMCVCINKFFFLRQIFFYKKVVGYVEIIDRLC
jgi:hypothetical protein